MNELLSLSNNSDRRTFHRYSVLHIPEIRGIINFQTLDAALIDISLGGCKFRYFENPHLRFLKSTKDDFLGINYITLEWPSLNHEPTTYRAKVRHTSEFQVGEILVCEIGFEFYQLERALLSPLIAALTNLA